MNSKDFKIACVIGASAFVIGGIILIRTIVNFAGNEHELMILAAGMAFLAAGWFLGILSGFQTVARSLSIRPEPKWEVELVEVPYGGHFWCEGKEYIVESTANTRAICRNIITGVKTQISTYATVKVWTDYYKEVREFNEHMEKCREKKRASSTEHVTIKGKFTMGNRMFQLESEGILTDALNDFSKQYDVELNRKEDDSEDSEMKI